MVRSVLLVAFVASGFACNDDGGGVGGTATGGAAAGGSDEGGGTSQGAGGAGAAGAQGGDGGATVGGSGSGGAAPTCADGALNGDETDVDCGGLQCPLCDLDRDCLVDSDCVTGHCQIDSCDVWQLASHGVGDDMSGGVAIGPDGEIVVCGRIPGNTDYGAINLPASNQDIFIAKLDRFGAFIWAKNFGGTSAEHCYDVAVDDDGNIYAVGNLLSSNFIVGGQALPYVGGYDAFVLKVDPDGNAVWGQSWGDAVSDVARGVAVSPNGNVIVTGRFWRSASIGGVALSSTDFDEIYVAAFDRDDGSTVWAKSFGGATNDGGLNVAVDTDGNIAVVGYATDTWTLAGTSVGPGTNAGDALAFVLDEDGEPIWARSVGSPTYGELFESASFAPDGSLYVTGYYWHGGPMDFGGGPLPSLGLTETFVAKLAPGTGATLWAKPLLGEETESGLDVAATPDGGVALIGVSSSTMLNLGGGVLTPGGDLDVFVAHYDEDGTHLFSDLYGGSDLDGLEPQTDELAAIAVDPSTRNIVAAAPFANEGDNSINFSKLQTPITSVDQDWFLVSLGRLE